MKYITPDFDVTIYEIEDVITLSIGTGNVDGGAGSGGAGDNGWWG